MTRLRWPAQLPPDELGLVAHGPVVVARSPGIAAGLRCVFAHPGGLHLLLVLRADGVQAEAASRRSRHRTPDAAPDPWSGPELVVDLDGEARLADPSGRQSSSSADRFDLEADYWIGALPADGRLRLTVGWPEAGLREAGTLLELGSLEGLDRVVRLR